jgi:hypothetical protein
VVIDYQRNWKYLLILTNPERWVWQNCKALVSCCNLSLGMMLERRRNAERCGIIVFIDHQLRGTWQHVATGAQI